MILTYKTSWGLKLFGAGTNETAAFLAGVNVKRVRFTSYVASGVLASLIGLLLLGNMGIAFKDKGSNYVMPSIAAAVVGGVSLTGGDGNYIGVILGAIFLQTLTNLLVALGWGDAGKWLGFGVVLFILLIVYVSNRRKRSGAGGRPRPPGARFARSASRALSRHHLTRREWEGRGPSRWPPDRRSPCRIVGASGPSLRSRRTSGTSMPFSS